MSKQICHAHCPPGSHGGPGLGLVLAVALVIAVGAGVRTAAPHVESAAREVLHLAELAAIVLASLAGLAAVGWAVHTRRPAADTDTAGAAEAPAVQQRPALPASAAAMLSASRAVLAIEAPRPYADQTTGVADVTGPAPITTRRNP